MRLLRWEILRAQPCASHKAENRLARSEGPPQVLPLSRNIKGQSFPRNSPNILSVRLQNHTLLHRFLPEGLRYLHQNS